MKIFCSTIELTNAIFTVINAVPQKKTIPILEGIKITASGNELVVTATDLELSLEKKIKADVKKEGEVVVPGKLIADFIKKIPVETIELDATVKNELKLKYSVSLDDKKVVFKCFPPDEYPVIRNVQEELSFTIFQKELKDVINKTIFAAATDDIRPVLRGCLFDIQDGILTAVALDGFRLAKTVKKLECHKGDCKLIIPVRTLQEIRKVLEKEDELTTIFVQNNYLSIEIGDFRLTSRLIDGEFIAYEKIIPAEFTTVVTANSTAVKEGLDRASVISRSDKQNLIKIEAKEKSLKISSETEVGNLNETVDAELTGVDLLIAFNAKFMIDCMTAIDDGTIKLNMNSSKMPAVITPVSGDEFLYLILPVRITS